MSRELYSVSAVLSAPSLFLSINKLQECPFSEDYMKDHSLHLCAWYYILKSVWVCDALKCPALPVSSTELIWVPCTLPPKKQSLGSFSLHSLQDAANDTVGTWSDRAWVYDPSGTVFSDDNAGNSCNSQSNLFAFTFWIWGIRGPTAFLMPTPRRLTAKMRRCGAYFLFQLESGFILFPS